MCIRIQRTVAAAVVAAGISLVYGCDSGSLPLAVISDADPASEETESAGTDISGDTSPDTGTEAGSDTESDASGDTDIGDIDDSAGSDSEDTASEAITDSETSTDNEAGSVDEAITDSETSTGNEAGSVDEAIIDSETSTDNEAGSVDEAITDNEASTDSETGGDNGGDTGAPVAAFEAEYRATFVATWSADTHPINFPGNPHFSPLTGAVHSEQSVFWEMGQNATDGIELMAETGATSILLTEVQSVVDEGRALSSIEGGGVGESPGSTSVEFTVNRDYPLVTLVSMLAPSPDWFIGVNSLQMIDENGDFRPLITIDLNLYDSGTDGGTRYTSADADIPRSPIDLVNSFPLDSDFQGGQPFVGQLTLELIQ